MIRARELCVPFKGRTGRWNAITDVAGVEVGDKMILCRFLSFQGLILTFGTASLNICSTNW